MGIHFLFAASLEWSLEVLQLRCFRTGCISHPQRLPPGQARKGIFAELPVLTNMASSVPEELQDSCARHVVWQETRLTLAQRSSSFLLLFCKELLFFFKDAAICISALRLGFVWNMGSFSCLAICFCFESPSSTEPELKLYTPRPSINTRLCLCIWLTAWRAALLCLAGQSVYVSWLYGGCSRRVQVDFGGLGVSGWLLWSAGASLCCCLKCFVCVYVLTYPCIVVVTEMDCSWKPREAAIPLFLLDRSLVINDFILGRGDCWDPPPNTHTLLLL